MTLLSETRYSIRKIACAFIWLDCKTSLFLQEVKIEDGGGGVGAHATWAEITIYLILIAKTIFVIIHIKPERCNKENCFNFDSKLTFKVKEIY